MFLQKYNYVGLIVFKNLSFSLNEVIQFLFHQDDFR